MSLIKPFKALRPNPEVAKQVSCVPYDVPYEDEVREQIAANPLSFLRITRSEAEFPPGTHPDTEAILARSATLFSEFQEKGILVPDPEPGIYIYRLTMGNHIQTGIVACCSLDEYKDGLIKKHEKTRPDKVADRTEHMIRLRAQTGLILLGFRETDEILRLIAEDTEREPVFMFDGPDGIGQTVWVAKNPDEIAAAFKKVAALYVADGHHRIESALRAKEALAKDGGAEAGWVMAGIFPACELKILPYNRAVKNLNGLDTNSFLLAVDENFHIHPAMNGSAETPGSFRMYLAGKWYKLDPKTDTASLRDPIERLDVSVLQNRLLEPILGIDDPRTNSRITFVGGGRGTAELVRLVDQGHAAVAFSLFPTSMEDLFAVSDAGEIMPPKSTWFEPKLKDGLFVHKI